MAKLNSYYGLCPLIDQKTLLGVAEDVEKGHVIVTLGKNIAIKYRLSDQKQIQSWRTKHKFTSPVIFDKDEGSYVSCFNQISLRLWSNDIENLDKVKKYKFTKLIYTIINCNSKSFVIFKNGCVMTLKSTLEQRKNITLKDVLDVKKEEIIDVIYSCHNSNIYIGLILSSESIKTCLWVAFTGDSLIPKYYRKILMRNGCDLIGYTSCHMSQNLCFLSLWSDGQLYSYSLTNLFGTESETRQTEEFGTCCGKVKYISCKQLVAMTALANDHIAIYGADCNQEGASVIIYNTQFKVVQSRQMFKMFTSTAKIWTIENVILLCSGQYLAVVPFHTDTQEISELVEGHKLDLTDSDIQQAIVVKKMTIHNEADYSNKIPLQIRKDVMNCLSQGLSESGMCDYLIPIYIENVDINAIDNCFDYFGDILESHLIKILAFLIENQLSHNDLQMPVHCINKLLSLTCTSNLSLPHMKEYFTVDVALYFLKYISCLLSSELCLPNSNFIETESKLIDWAGLLLDSNYQKFLLSSDALILKEVENFSALVQEHLMYLCELQSFEPMLNEYIRRKTVPTNHNNNNIYSIEDIKLY